MNQVADLEDSDYVEMETSGDFSYGDILTLLATSGEVVLVVPIEEAEKIKTGLKNKKAKQNAFLKEQGLPQDDSVLNFTTTPSPLGEDLVSLGITIKQKNLGIVKVFVPSSTSL